MKKIKIIFLILMTAIVAIKAAGQDPNITQFQNAPMYYNPAYAGLYTGVRARFLFRDQAPALPYDFKAYHFSADFGNRNLPGSGGVGLILNSDNEGIWFIRNFNLGIALSVRIPIISSIIGQIGVKAAWLQKSVDWDDFVFTDELDESYGYTPQTGFIPPDKNVLNMPDFGVGGILQFANVQGSYSGTVGLSVDHLFEPDQSFLQTAKSPLPRKWVAHADMIFVLGRNTGYNLADEDILKFNPGIIYQDQDGRNSLQAGMNLTKYGVYLGLWFKGAFGAYSNEAMTFMGGYRFTFVDNMSFKFTYSYDMQLAGALQGTGGAHEISLILEFLTGDNKSKRDGSIRTSGNNGRLECSEF